MNLLNLSAITNMNKIDSTAFIMKLSNIFKLHQLNSPFNTKTLLLMSATIPMLAHSAVNDVNLNSLIIRAIDTHPLVGSAISEQKATQEGINAAKRNMLPTPSVSTGYGTNNDMVTSVNISQPLWTAGKLTANVNQAIFDDKAAVEHVFEKQNEVAKNTIDAWKSYISAVSMQRVYEKSLRQLDEFEAMMKRRVAQGVSARIELDLLTNRILQQQSANQAAKEQERIAIARLEQIIGSRLATGSAYSVPPLETLTQEAKNQSANYERMVFDEASFRNATVVKEYYQIESAKQSLEADEAANYPSVYAQYSYEYNHDTKDNNDGFTIGMNYEPGAGFSNVALARASQARVNSLLQSQEASRRTIMENIQTQYQQFASAKDKELSLMATDAGNQIVLDSYRRQFIAGRKSWLDVLNAVRDQSSNRIELVQTRSDMLGSFYSLQVDLGEMPWQEFQFNRQAEPLFHAFDPVSDWLGQQDNIPKSIQTAPDTLKEVPEIIKQEMPQELKEIPDRLIKNTPEYLRGIPDNLKDLVEKTRRNNNRNQINQF